LHGYEPAALAEDVLVEDGGTLADEGDADPARPAHLDEVFACAEHPFLSPLGSLGHEGVGFVDEQVQRGAVPGGPFAVVEAFGERGEEPGPVRFAEQRQVEDRGDLLVDDHVGYELPAGRFERDVRLVASDDDDLVAGGTPVGAAGQTPQRARR